MKGFHRLRQDLLVCILYSTKHLLKCDPAAKFKVSMMFEGEKTY